MRPVNLIPGSQRKGERTALREGWLSYAVIAVLVLVLGGVVALVLTGNKIADHKSEIADLQQRQAVAEQRAAEARPVRGLRQPRADPPRDRRVAGPEPLRLGARAATSSPSSSRATSGSPRSAGPSAAPPRHRYRGSSSGGVDALRRRHRPEPDDHGLRDKPARRRELPGLAARHRRRDPRRAAELAALGRRGELRGSIGVLRSGGGSCTGTRPLESFQALAAFDSVQVPSLDATSTTTPAAPATGTTTTRRRPRRRRPPPRRHHHAHDFDNAHDHNAGADHAAQRDDVGRLRARGGIKLSTERLVTIVAGVVAVLAAFWFLALSPKLKQESDLQGQVTTLRASAEQAEQDATAGLQQRHTYHKSYATLVRLGKAVPADSDTPSLLTQVDGISNRAGTQLDGVTLSGRLEWSHGRRRRRRPRPRTRRPRPPRRPPHCCRWARPSDPRASRSCRTTWTSQVTTSRRRSCSAGSTAWFTSTSRSTAPTSRIPPARRAGSITINSFSLSTESLGRHADLGAQGTLSMTTYLAPADQGLTGGATTTSPVPDGVDAHGLRQRGPGRRDGDAMKQARDALRRHGPLQGPPRPAPADRRRGPPRRDRRDPVRAWQVRRTPRSRFPRPTTPGRPT